MDLAKKDQSQKRIFVRESLEQFINELFLSRNAGRVIVTYIVVGQEEFVRVYKFEGSELLMTICVTADSVLGLVQDVLKRVFKFLR